MWVSPFHTHLAVKALHQGQLIAYPTESVYGLGCDPNNLQAVEKLLHLKSRPAEKGFILIAADIEQLEPWVEFQKVQKLQQIINSWPGPVTWLVPAKSHVPSLITGNHETIAVRVSAHPVVQQLCQQFGGPITSTSANKSAMKEARDLFSTRRVFGNKVGYYVPGIVSGDRKPSMIRDAISGKIIRN